jgi:tellurite resistance protein TerC
MHFGMYAGATLNQWIGFHLLLAVLLALDLIFSGNQPTLRRALILTAGWVAVALAFAAYIQHAFGHSAALEYIAGYSIEQSLSLDNLFVFLLLFRSFGVPHQHQRRVLFWGILGAIIMRGTFIFGGIALITRFHWIQFLFALVLLFAAIRLLIHSSDESGSAPRWATTLQRFCPYADASSNSAGKFFLRTESGLQPTLLLLALIAIEFTDVLFALDSVPAVLAVTHRPFIAYTSNLFAVMGLRALYFVLAGMLYRLHRLHYGLAALLAFVAAKMLLADWIIIPIPVSLAIILLILAATIAASLLWPKQALANPEI